MEFERRLGAMSGPERPYMHALLEVRGEEARTLLDTMQAVGHSLDSPLVRLPKAAHSGWISPALLDTLCGGAPSACW